LGDDLSKPRPMNHKYELSVRPSGKLTPQAISSLEEVDVSSFLEQVLSQIPDLEIYA